MKEIQAKQRDWSGPEQGEMYVAMFQDYLNSLKAQAQRLPADNKGKPNITKISEDSGIPRASFYTNKMIRRLLNGALGISEETSVDNGKDSYYQEQIEALNRCKQQLEQQVALQKAEIEGLRQKLSCYEVIENSVIKAGRRILL